ncbi:amino acid permease [Stakelama sediminis]|uniref:APA family basic amino acid/polyamine antiporter n=1 Tax=Stakelama sediminis TaxID=463200 RepID=A0A840Z342_9SPHN|nr:APA family basic amino acid/polyamine antiporter [Stakelama sediminis]
MPRRAAPITIRKPLEAVRLDAETAGMHRTLGPVQLMLIGIGCIVGAGVYVMTGTAAAEYAGPAVILSFVIAGLACGFTALCYAELSSVLPVSGASYTYAYAALGEVTAWALAWMLMLEFGLASAALAVGFSGYLNSLLGDFAVHIPPAILQSTLVAQTGPQGTRFVFSPSLNLIALASLAVVALILIRGIRHSAAVNTLLVIVKVGVLLGFVVVGFGHVDTHNWTPFIPQSEGRFRYGVAGIFRAASILFFAYLGFEAVATAAAEARHPQRDIPIGILGALAASTLLYVAVGLTMTGLVPFRALGVPDPIAVAVEAVGAPVLSIIIKGGALTGLASVLLVNTYGHSRICFAMATDGMLPDAFRTLHPRFATPATGTIIIAAIAGIAAALLPITLLADLVSIGTAFVFSVVAISTMWLRTAHPDLTRPFRVPLGGIWVRGVWIGTVPVLALLFCLTMMGPVLIDIAGKAIGGDWIPAAILGGYILCGALLYAGYGYRHSRLAGATTA